MPNTHTTLTSLFSDIADEIRAKKGTSGQIVADDFPDEIASISAGEINPEEYVWQQTPTAVQNYLDYVAAHTYDPDDYTYSVIQNYLPASPVEANQRPVGKTIHTEAGTLERDGYKKTVTSGNTTVYNDIPNKYTEFSVSTNGEVKQTGTLKPNKPLRQIMTTANNVRDLGGWDCDGGTIKYGKLFRGGELSASDREVLVGQLGIRVDLDLRGDDVSLTGSPIGSDIKYIRYEEENWYSLSNKEAWKTNLRCIFESVKNNEPVYFHCLSGADRTGTLACVIEALLGVSQSDIDCDYEITNFWYYQPGTIHDRKRLNADWVSLINQIKEYSGSTFMDKAVTFVATLGFTAAEINAFRESMIDGNPQTVSPSISTFTVTNDLTHATSDNDSASATQYQPYEANITPDSGYKINSVQILMGGVDVTNEVWEGKETNLFRSVTKNLVHCSINNQKVSVIDRQGYGTEITVEDGYTLDGATVSITMGGVDITSQVYKAYEEA